MGQARFTPELISPCGMNCGYAELTLLVNMRFHVKEAEYHGAMAAFPEAKTSISNEAAKSFQNMKFNHVANMKQWPVKNWRIWTSATVNVMT
jgi:hypothetical protein